MVETDVRTLTANVALILLSVGIVVAAFEGALAMEIVGDPEYPKIEYCEAPHGEHRVMFHERYGHNQTPSTQYLWKKTTHDDWDVYTHNEFGFRDTYDSGEETVVMLGDSYLYGSLVGDNETFEFLLDRWTGETEFRNYGGPGYDTDQELMVYRDVANRTEHELVVLQFYLGNDMDGNVADALSTPHFEVRNGSAKLVRLARNETGDGDLSATGLNAVQNFLRENVRTYAFLEPRIKRLFDSVTENTNVPPTGEQRQAELRLTRALIEEIAKEAQRNDADLLIVPIPERGDVNPDNPFHYRKADGQSYWNDQREMIREIEANRSNVHHLNVTTRYRAEYDNSTHVYGKIDGHLNDYGHRVTAQEVYQWLEAYKRVDTGVSPEFSRHYPANRSCEPPA